MDDSLLAKCVLCPRQCGANRILGRTGYCRSGAVMRVARAALHMWEEPCISGTTGSGTVFFTGCSLRCSFCQNAEISFPDPFVTGQINRKLPEDLRINRQDPEEARVKKQDPEEPRINRQDPEEPRINRQDPEEARVKKQDPEETRVKKQDPEETGIKRRDLEGSGEKELQPGKEVSPGELVEIFLQLQSQGAANINLVTAGHFIIPCVRALRAAKEKGLTIPVVYNSSGYELPQTLHLLDGLVDIYLPDFKFMDPELARLYCRAPDYPETAKRSLSEMVRQIETRYGKGAGFDARGMMTHGVIVRQLLLPGHVRDAKNIIDYLYHTWKDRIWISMMSQYTPMERMKEDPLLRRKVTKREYERLVGYALSLGISNAFIQEGDVAEKDYIPPFG